MKNYLIELPQGLCSHGGDQKKVRFEMSRRHFEINGVQYDNPLNQHINKDVKGYMHKILNKAVLVTLFYNDDILEVV